MSDAGAIRAGQAYIEISADDRALQTKLQSVQQHLNRTAKQMAQIGAAVAGAGAAIVGPLVAAAASAAAFGDALNDLSAKTGIAVANLASLGFAAEQSGASIDTIETSIKFMQKNLADAANGSAEAAKALALLGVTAEQLQGMAPDEQFRRLADSIAAITDPSQKANAALKIFGKSGTDLLPLFANGAKGLRDLEQRARDLNIVMGAEAAAAIGSFDDALNENQQQLTALKNTIGAAVAEAILPFRDSIAGALASTIAWAKENRQFIQIVGGLGLSLIAIGGTLLAVAGTIKLVVVTTQTLVVAMTALRAAMVAHPILLLAGVLAAIAAAYVIVTNAASTYTEALVTQGTKARQAGDAQRAATESQLVRLEQLSEQQRLTTDEMNEAEAILRSLEKTYGALGVTIDATTGRLVGLAGAQTAVNAKMDESLIKDLKKQLIEAQANARITAAVEPSIFSPTFESENAVKLATLEKYKEQIIAIYQELRDLETGKMDTPSVRDADEKIARMNAELVTLRDGLANPATLKVDVDASAIKSAMDDVQARIDAANAAFASGSTESNTQAARNERSRLYTELADLQAKLAASGPATTSDAEEAARKRILEIEKSIAAIRATISGAKPAEAAVAEPAKSGLPRAGSVEDQAAFERQRAEILRAREQARREDMTDAQRARADADKAAKERFLTAYNIRAAELGRGPNADMSRVRFAEDELEQLKIDHAKAVAEIQRTEDEKRYDFLFDQELELARLRGDKATEAALIAQKTVQDTERQFKDAGLTGAALDEARRNARAIADETARAAKPDDIFSGIRAQVFTSAQAALSGFSGQSSQLNKIAEKQAKRVDDIYVVLGRIAEKVGLPRFT